MDKKAAIVVIAVVVIAIILILAMLPPGTDNGGGVETIDRHQAIPLDAVKMGPQLDEMPPILHNDLWHEPIPMEGPIDTAGLEDSPFITPDGQRFFFFFTPAWGVPAEEQLYDGVTGIWWSQLSEGNWSEPERILLSDDISLDGAQVVMGDDMWFASVRVGNYREIDIYTVRYVDGSWTDVQNAGEIYNQQYELGEFHFSPDCSRLYYGWDGGVPEDDRDIWFIERENGDWGTPTPVQSVNSDLNEDQPFITPDGLELWFTGQSRLGYPGPAIYRSLWNGTNWGEPEEVISQFAGEPCLDGEGNVYFVHHFCDPEDGIVEADIYVAYRK